MNHVILFVVDGFHNLMGLILLRGELPYHLIHAEHDELSNLVPVRHRIWILSQIGDSELYVRVVVLVR
jgi:hypothetical protein